MRKIVILMLVMVLCAATIFTMSACNGNSNGDNNNSGATYALDDSNFEKTVAFGEEINYNKIIISKTSNGNTLSIPVDRTMVTGDANSIGTKDLIISFDNQTFVVTIFVKYRVEFVSEGEVVSTQFVLNTNEIELPEVKVPENKIFKGWKGLPDTLKDNVVIEAQYDFDVPKLSSNGRIDAEYEDTLADITLPYNSLGKWVPVLDGKTPVGAVGSRTEYEFNFVLDSTAPTGVFPSSTGTHLPKLL